MCTCSLKLGCSHVHISSEKLAGVILLIQMFSYSTVLYANIHTHALSSLGRVAGLADPV